MPISLRLPAELETRIAGFGARLGLSKSAVIVRSIQEFLALHAQPSSLQIYQEAMHDMQDERGDAKREAAEQRAHKLQARAVIRRKHAQRPERAVQAQAQVKAKPKRSDRPAA